MRKIKFRGKLLYIEEWTYGSLIIDESQKIVMIADNESGIANEVDKETVGQYTGLNDKNGKEIYEGDIVKITEKKNILKHKVIPMKPIIAEISWSEEYLAYILITTSAKDAFENLADYLEEYDLEKIGTIYDNPELLEEGE